MTISESVALTGLVVGSLLPAGIDLIKRQHWTSQEKGIVAFLCCLLAAAVTAYGSGQISSASDLVTAFATVFAAAEGTYHSFWDPSGISDRITSLTNPRPVPPAPAPDPVLVAPAPDVPLPVPPPVTPPAPTNG